MLEKQSSNSFLSDEEDAASWNRKLTLMNAKVYQISDENGDETFKPFDAVSQYLDIAPEKGTKLDETLVVNQVQTYLPPAVFLSGKNKIKSNYDKNNATKKAKLVIDYLKKRNLENLIEKNVFTVRQRNGYGDRRYKSHKLVTSPLDGRSDGSLLFKQPHKQQYQKPSLNNNLATRCDFDKKSKNITTSSLNNNNNEFGGNIFEELKLNTRRIGKMGLLEDESTTNGQAVCYYKTNKDPNKPVIEFLTCTERKNIKVSCASGSNAVVTTGSQTVINLNKLLDTYVSNHDSDNINNKRKYTAASSVISTYSHSNRAMFRGYNSSSSKASSFKPSRNFSVSSSTNKRQHRQKGSFMGMHQHNNAYNRSSGDNYNTHNIASEVIPESASVSSHTPINNSQHQCNISSIPVLDNWNQLALYEKYQNTLNNIGNNSNNNKKKNSNSNNDNTNNYGESFSTRASRSCNIVAAVSKRANKYPPHRPHIARTARQSHHHKYNRRTSVATSTSTTTTTTTATTNNNNINNNNDNNNNNNNKAPLPADKQSRPSLNFKNSFDYISNKKTNDNNDNANDNNRIKFRTKCNSMSHVSDSTAAALPIKHRHHRAKSNFSRSSNYKNINPSNRISSSVCSSNGLSVVGEEINGNYMSDCIIQDDESKLDGYMDDTWERMGRMFCNSLSDENKIKSPLKKELYLRNLFVRSHLTATLLEDLDTYQHEDKDVKEFSTEYDLLKYSMSSSSSGGKNQKINNNYNNSTAIDKANLCNISECRSIENIPPYSSVSRPSCGEVDAIIEREVQRLQQNQYDNTIQQLLYELQEY